MGTQIHLFRFVALAVALSLPLLSGLGCARRFEKAGGPPPDAALKVRTHQVAPQPFRETFAASATIMPNESVIIKSESEGRIVGIGFVEGERVEKGRVLFRLDPEKLNAALKEAQAAFALAEANRARAEEMLKANAISAQEFDVANSAYLARKAAVDLLARQLEDSVIRAPFDGVMGARLVSPGQMVGRLTPLASLVDQSRVKVEFRLPERLAPSVHIGMPVALRVAAWPDEAFEGQVSFISPDLDPATRTLLVRADLDNSSGRLRGGMFARVDLVLNEIPDALLIPDIALMQRGDKTFVYVVGDDSRAQLREVTTGPRVSGRVLVLSGLAPREVVVTEGHQKLGPNSRTDAS